MRKLIVISFIFIAFSCDKKSKFDGPSSYQDSFETYADVNDLIDGDNEQWSFFQNTYEANFIEVDSGFSHSGQKSMHFYAEAGSDDKASKASINKQFMAFWEGETVQIDFWCYLVGSADAQWLFLFDLEEKVPVGAGPGMRLALVDDRLLVEHKYPNPNIVQQESLAKDFPRDQWVNIVFETKLSRKKEGYVKLWQDGELLIDQQNWQTLPKDLLYFQQGTNGGYDQIEFGLTANTQNNPMEMYVDDINVLLVE